MDYEKGKKVETAINDLKRIVGLYSYGDDKLTDLEDIYDRVQTVISDLENVLR